MHDDFDLQRFVDAQDGVIDAVRRELGAGAKRSHWMWFVFPQLRGLGFSAMAQHYGIESMAEARAYLRHPVLGARLVECTQLVLDVKGRSLHQVFGSPDDMKFRSSMTLFREAGEAGSVFAQAIERCCEGRADEQTLQMLGH